MKNRENLKRSFIWASVVALILITGDICGKVIFSWNSLSPDEIASVTIHEMHVSIDGEDRQVMPEGRPLVLESENDVSAFCDFMDDMFIFGDKKQIRTAMEWLGDGYKGKYLLRADVAYKEGWNGYFAVRNDGTVKLNAEVYEIVREDKGDMIDSAYDFFIRDRLAEAGAGVE